MIELYNTDIISWLL